MFKLSFIITICSTPFGIELPSGTTKVSILTVRQRAQGNNVCNSSSSTSFIFANWLTKSWRSLMCPTMDFSPWASNLEAFYCKKFILSNLPLIETFHFSQKVFSLVFWDTWWNTLTSINYLIYLIVFLCIFSHPLSIILFVLQLSP